MPDPIPIRPHIPILGQAVTFRDWWPTALLNCGCDSRHALLIQGVGNAATCPSCRKSFVITRLAVAPDGQVGVEIGQVTLRQEPS